MIKSTVETTSTDIPNVTTIKTINDVKTGRTFEASSVDDVLRQCLH